MDEFGFHVMSLHAENGPPEWIHLLPTGTFSGSDGRGPYTLKDASAVIKASMNGTPLVIDYDHQTDYAANEKVGGKAPAAGWIAKLESRSDGVWGRVEWTEAGGRAVASKEYRFNSPVFAHTKNGEVIKVIRAGLTNKPNLTLTAISSAQGNPEGNDMDELLKTLREAMGLPADADQAAVTAACAQLSKDHKSAIAAMAKIATTIKADDATAKDPDKVATAVASALGSVSAIGKLSEKDRGELVTALQADGGPAKVMAALQAGAGTAGNPDPARFVPIEQVTSLQSQVTTLMSERVASKVDASIEDGKIAPGQKEWALAYCAKDEAGFDAFVKAQPAIHGTGTKVSGTPTKGADLTPEERAICAANGQSEADFKKHRDSMLEVG